MTIWDELTLEQYAVMIAAIEEAYLVDVMDEYGMRLQWAKTGDRGRSSNLDDDAKRRLVPHFATVVADMVTRNWIEVREPNSGNGDDAEPMTPAQLHDALHDPTSWLGTLDSTHRMVMLMRTDEWDHFTAGIH
ncbi:hypothetical protein GCM10022251_73930 [Phytohabitans flavus]|uniref:Uncharacterized protein n=1 Tax=Phytohabitans flavus TaxID=1076124 RepID=A0A6F8XKY0_9ACTN|nr:hypothetical protein [Phytohabitans flavus]BCB74470.1 hypothetical protein Pflav_008800 [Phytohabitans flavus]